jgi:hypothetical protein
LLYLDAKENLMRFWKPQLGLASATGAVPALAVTLFVRRGVDVLVMILIGAALVGMYLLRRYARAELLYHPHAESRRRAHRAEPEPVRHAPPAGRRDPTGSGGASAVHARAEQRTSVPDRQVIPAGASVRCR